MASNYYQNLVSSGLGTTTLKVPDAGPYMVQGKISLPQINTGASANSAVVTVVNKNGSPVYTGTAGAEGFGVEVTCAANDTLTIVLSSAATVDQPANVIKANISISGGL